MITAKLKNGKLTGAYQKGDWSKHPLFNERDFKIFNSFKEFEEALKNVYLPFSEDEIKALTKEKNDDHLWR